MIRSLLVLSFFIGLPASVAAEIICEPTAYTCTQTSTGSAGGLTLETYCSREVGTQSCVDTQPLNACAALEISLNCQITSQECADYENGTCVQSRFDWSCLNEDDDMSPAELIDTTFGPIQEDIESQCDPLEDDPRCDLTTTVDVEGDGIRTINRKDFARSWWARQRQFSCIVPGEGENDCGPLESNPSCTFVDDTCLVADANGVCSNRSFHYHCGVDNADLQTSCQPINVCVGENCLGVEQESTDSFGEAAAWLNALAQMQEEYRSSETDDPNNVRFFTGSPKDCSKTIERDCCDGDGIFAQCSQDNEILWDMRDAGLTHYVGSTCSETIFGACVKRRYYYCTFDSKLGRVFVEQLKRLKGESWNEDDPRHADCGWVTLEDLANIDIDQMDLSEVFGDMKNQINVPLMDELQDFYLDRFPSASTQAQGVYNGENP
ncbi:conjugal transfer protein TraN [uncultured Tateyamaria sp.]|uniref:conjugal transfer protein TraN n=1 Tax=uncultured Tateyamaria sp. TaxID=455651 RepID=UPI00261E466C|nr:conjugal transfer protein TraN [uncultured Tateyamaria sp.]